MKTIKRFLFLLPMLLMWLMLSAFFWNWVFMLLTDAAPEQKVTVFTHVGPCEDTALAARLEQDLPAGVRMVQVHPFSYAMMDGDQLKNADLYIVRASDLETYREWFAPVPAVLADSGLAVWQVDGAAFGLRIYDAAAATGAARSYITYTAPDGTDEDCYLCFGARSLHLPGNDAARDDAAVRAAQTLFQLP